MLGDDFFFCLFIGAGYGDTENRGDSADDMGDALAVVDLGSVLIGPGLFLAEGVGYQDGMCAFMKSSSLLLKCFGLNNYGQLGYGDTNRRGDASGEMGDNLPFIDLNFTVITAAPTSNPTSVCDESEMYGVIWHDLVCYILYIVYLSLYMFLLKVRENTRSLRELSH